MNAYEIKLMRFVTIELQPKLFRTTLTSQQYNNYCTVRQLRTVRWYKYFLLAHNTRLPTRLPQNPLFTFLTTQRNVDEYVTLHLKQQITFINQNNNAL